MKFLIDAQLPPALCRWLLEKGHDCIHVSSVLPGDARDADIAAYAASEGLILISKDEDFSALPTVGGFTLLWLRCGNSTNERLSAWLEPRWPSIERLLGSGETLVEVR